MVVAGGVNGKEGRLAEFELGHSSELEFRVVPPAPTLIMLEYNSELRFSYAFRKIELSIDFIV